MAQQDKAIKLAMAIAKVESGGNYQAKGGSGESGAFQFMPSTWKGWAKQYLGDANAPLTKANQNQVAVKRVSDLLDKGYDERQVALSWNAGSPVEVKGVNKYGVKYDSGAYANKVISQYNNMKNNSTTASTTIDKGIDNARKLGKTDTEILDYLKTKNSTLSKKIDELKIKAQQTGRSDREVLNFISKQTTGKEPTVPSVPIKVDEEAEKESFGLADYLNPLKFYSSKNPLVAGASKGALQTIKGMSSLGEKILQIPGKVLGVNYDKKTAAEELIPEKYTEAVGTGEKIGKGVEQILEYFIPASKASKAEKFINVLSKGIKTPVLAAGARILGKAGVQGLATGGVNLIQTGGDVKQARNVALTSGIIRGGMAIIGEGARALHLPERLYSTIFKNSKQDMLAELKSGGMQALQKNNPQKFQEFVDKGIIKLSSNGTPILNDTLAEEALAKGLQGSIRNMSNEVVEKTLESEDKVRQIASNYKGTVNLSEKQFTNVLKNIVDDYKDVGFGEISKEADDLVKLIKTGKGNVSAETAVNIKRLLDRVRIATSFNQPTIKLSQSQANLKTLADAVRGRVNSIPEMGNTMKDYSFYLEAMEALAKEAMRRGNNQVLSLIDSLFLSGAYSGNNPIPGVTMGALRKILQSASGTTLLGQLLNRSNISTPLQGLTSGGSAGVQSLLKDQE